MATVPTYNAVTVLYDTDKGSTFSQSYTFPSSLDNPCLVVVATGEKGPISASSTATYNSVSMTRVTALDSSSDAEITVFVLANPATGSNTLAVDFINTTENIILYAIAVEGVDQDTPSGGSATQEDSTSPYQITYTANDADSLLIIGGRMRGGSGAFTIDSSSMTLISSENSGDTAGTAYKAPGDTSSHTYGFANTNDEITAIALIELSPVPSGFISRTTWL